MKSYLTNPILKSSRRAGALATITAAVLLCGINSARANADKLGQGLTAYDAAVGTDAIPAVTKLTTPVTLDGTAGAPFNFGPTLGDVTMEFILKGDPTGDVQILAIGENTTSTLRYVQWQNTSRLGFTQAGVADYQFTPQVASPANLAHIAYVWNAFEFTMSLYVNGVLAGTTTGVSDQFAMPTGEGFLGSDLSGGALMKGTIYRLTVYPAVLPPEEIQRHADAFANIALPIIKSFTSTPAEITPPGSAVLNWEVQNATAVYLNDVLVTGTSQTVTPAATSSYTLLASNEVAVSTLRISVPVNPRLDVYDAAIAADQTAGLTPLIVATNTITLTGAGGEPFDFGLNSGDVTMEFILEGDSAATGDSGYLAVGENTTSNLRYEQWQNTRQMGFTQLGVADYMFVPAVPSPQIATHVTYIWNATTFSMQLYVNGVASGTINNVSDQFAMPTGIGSLGANPGGGEAMVGRIFRVVVYDDIVSPEAIKRHADAFTSVLRPPIVSSFTASPELIVGQGSSTLSWVTENATAVFLNGVNVTSVTNQTVSPTVTTVYTLIASNNVSTATATVSVLVDPLLAPYDEVIAADQAGGLVPVTTLTNTVTLNGTAGVPFDFGATFGDVTMEFIVEGNPLGRPNGYLAVGENTTSNLRYAQWQNTQQMGFTQLGVADYLFTPAVSSPTAPTHVTYVWNSAEGIMNLYTNGVLAGTTTGVTLDFAMPTGPGFLGANPTGAEAMVGRIFRVVVYSGILPDATIQKHADALQTGPVTGPSISIALNGAQPAITLQGETGTHYRVEYRNSLAATDAWQLLQDIPSLTGTTVTVNDTTATTGRTQRYYRAVMVP